MIRNLINYLVNNPGVTWLLILVYMLLIFYISSIPYLEQPLSIREPHAPFLEHILEYSLLGFLVFLGLLSRGNIPIRNAILLAILISSIYGISDEIHQIFVPGRTFDILDITADLSGSVIGAVVGNWLYISD